ncbi:MAG: hypothetical protein KF729_33620 [Sandaracinaceae bacterium]|nr:hypothetical protein [Sandaracinaceae bacterium]
MARVDVWDPTPEGEWIVENLRQSAVEVRAIELADVPLTRADLVLLAGDVAGALGALKLLRDEGEHGDVPVILLGVPDGMTHPGDGPGFGAEAVFRRPVEFAPLLARAFRLLESSRVEVSRVQLPVPERTMELSDPDDPDSSQVVLRPVEPAPEEDTPAWRPRERTQDLGDRAAPEGSREISRADVRAPYRSEPPSTTSSRTREPRSGAGTLGSQAGSSAGSEPSLFPPELEIPPERRTTLSPWLSELLRAADRRVFPDRAPIAVHIPAADQPPDELVPAELFEASPSPIDEPLAEDPIDAFTYVGGPAVPPPIQAGTGEGADEDDDELSSSAPRSFAEVPSAIVLPVRRPALEAPRPEVTTRTELPPLEPSAGARGGEWPADDTVLGQSAIDGARRGSLGPGGAIRLLWRIAALGLDALAELHLADGATLRLTFLGGALRGFDGPIASTVLDGLRRRGRATERPADEAGAEAALARRVDAGLLGRFERDRLMREARERLLVRVAAAERAEFVLRRLDDTQPGRVLARARMMRRPIRAALVEVAREALEAEQVTRLLGPGDPGLALGPEREAALAPAELTSELLELIVRMDGHRLSELLAAAPTEPGLAGLLFALVAGDALVLTDPPETRANAPRAAIVALIEAAAARALDADYFTVLGIGPAAGRGELERAHRERREELLAVPLEALDLAHLASARSEAVEALDEALQVLSDAGLRKRYAQAIGPVLS